MKTFLKLNFKCEIRSDGGIIDSHPVQVLSDPTIVLLQSEIVDQLENETNFLKSNNEQ